MNCQRQEAFVFLSQTLTVNPGTNYAASFYYQWFGVENHPTGAQMQIIIDGVPIFSASSKSAEAGHSFNTDWRFGQTGFTATESFVVFTF